MLYTTNFVPFFYQSMVDSLKAMKTEGVEVEELKIAADIEKHRMTLEVLIILYKSLMKITR